MRPDVYRALNWRMKLKLQRIAAHWPDRLYRQYLIFMLGHTIPLEEVAILRKNAVGPEQIREFCERFLLRGYDKTRANMMNPAKKRGPSRWANVEEATRFWAACTNIGHVQSYDKGEIEVTCD